jgi:hypothetical protein
MCSPCSKIIDQPCTIQPYFLQQAEICERHATRKCQNENWEVGWEMGLRRGSRNSQYCLPSSLALSEFIIASSASSDLVFQKPVNYSSWGGVIVTEEEVLSGYWEKDNTIIIQGVCVCDTMFFQVKWEKMTTDTHGGWAEWREIVHLYGTMVLEFSFKAMSAALEAWQKEPNTTATRKHATPGNKMMAQFIRWSRK